jgi:hypothetical protein
LLLLLLLLLLLPLLPLQLSLLLLPLLLLLLLLILLLLLLLLLPLLLLILLVLLLLLLWLVQVPGATLAYEDRVMEVTAKGVVLQGTSTLAGSCTTMHAIFTSLLTTFGLPVQQAVALCCETPAAVARLPHVGTLDVGRRADFVCLASLDVPGDLRRVFVAGAPVV